MAIFLLAYVATLSGQLYYWKSYFFTLFQSHYFDTTVTFLEQLFLQSSCFFWGASLSEKPLICSSYFFFQNNYFFRVKLFENGKFFRFVIFRNSYLFGKGFVYNKDFYRRAAFSKRILLHRINFFRGATWKQKKASFSIKQYSALPTFLQHTFSEELLFIATLPFHTQNSQYQLRAVKVGEFFLAYLLLL